MDKKILLLAIVWIISIVTVAIAAQAAATGGTITTDGNFIVHTFTANGSFNITDSITNATILIVGGGGGAAYGGGGAGGVTYLTGINITTNQTVVVGLGGAGSTNCDANFGTSGTTSYFYGYNGTGGGGGAKNGQGGLFGGSGGGGAGSTGGLSLSGQGYDGGSGLGWGTPYCGGSGGGAGQAGLATAASARPGGNGTLLNVTGTATYYGGGGASGCNSGGSTAPGGLGGGGSGIGGTGPGGDGYNGTGGGGGGSGSSQKGGRGGDGIVIIKYLNISLNPSISLDSQAPVNLTIANSITQGFNLTFATVDINLSTFKLYYSTNSTNNNVKDIIRGVKTYNPTPKDNCANVTATKMLCRLFDNELLRAIYNYNETAIESAALTVLKSFNNANDRLKTQFIDDGANYTFAFVEINCNGSTAAPMNIYYENSTGASVLLQSIPGNAAFNHRHSAASAHHVIGVPFNTTTKTILGVRATDVFYLEIRGSTGAAFNCYGLNGVSGFQMTETSANNGVTWAYITATPDQHLHGFFESTTFSARATAAGLDGLNYSFTTNPDVMESFALPPTAAAIAPIFNMQQNTTQLITWSRAESPQFAAINYSLALYNITGDFVAFLGLKSGLALNFSATYPLGNYSIGIISNDSAGLASGISYSNQFNITAPCTPVYQCSAFGPCLQSNVTACTVVTDISCGYAFNGTLSDYNGNCTYVPPVPAGALYDLNTTQGALIFGILLFFWVAMLTVSLIFRTMATAIIMWMVGILLGFWLFQIGPIWAFGFMLLDSAVMMTMGRFKR